MANQTATAKQRAYVQTEPSWGTIPNNAGAATLAGGDAYLCESLEMNMTRPLNQRPDKTGALGLLKGTPGRGSASWSTRCSLAGSGAAGTAPDIGPFLEALFGKVGQVAAGVSVTYAPEDDGNPSVTIWDFNRPATVAQRAIFGAIVQSGRFSWGDNFGMAEFSGEGKHVIDTDQFATADAAAKGGLSAIPAEPANPVTTGDAVTGYKGVITLDGKTYTTMRSGSIEVAVARELDHQNWDDDFPGQPIEGARTVTCEFTITDDDSADLKAMKLKAIAKTAFAAIIQIGKTAGNIWTFNVNRFVGEAPTYGYGETRRTVTFRGNATISAAGAEDEISIVCT
jgi:hypothetical protein